MTVVIWYVFTISTLNSVHLMMLLQRDTKRVKLYLIWCWTKNCLNVVFFFSCAHALVHCHTLLWLSSHKCNYMEFSLTVYGDYGNTIYPLNLNGIKRQWPMATISHKTLMILLCNVCMKHIEVSHISIWMCGTKLVVMNFFKRWIRVFLRKFLLFVVINHDEFRFHLVEFPVHSILAYQLLLVL